MKITISTNEVLERLYAISALHGYVNDTGGGDTTNILSPAQAPALRVIVRSAFSAAMSYLAFSGWKPDTAGGELCALAPDTLPVDADGAKAALTDAVTLLTLYIVYGAAADGRADRVHSQTLVALRHLESGLWHPAWLTMYRA